jgi:tellurite resistance protein TehA-like permease
LEDTRRLCWRERVADLPPSIFAVVMATGIVSLAALRTGKPLVAEVLFWLNLAAYAVLWVLFLARCGWHRARVAEDLRTHSRAPGFFTIAAGTCVLGSQCVALHGAAAAGAALWAVGIAAWFALTYAMLPGLMQGEAKPPLAEAVNGAWLLAVVATQAVCVLGCLLAEGGEHAGALLFAALLFWLVGGMLYVWIIALIFQRCLFLPLAPEDLTPPYWINMGAMAISTLAGASLVRQAAGLPLLGELLPFLRGMTLLFWATATWWIPMLLALGVWRHLTRRFPLTYDHGYWAAVFPLGMYAACTHALAADLGLPFLDPVPEVFTWVALAAWGAAFAGLLGNLARGVRGPVRPPGGASSS